MDRGIAKAHEKIAFVSRDKETLRAYQMREMALSDYTSGINHARREGMAIGEQRGIAVGEQRGIVIGKQQGKDETYHAIVRNAATKGIPVESISELTGLSAEKVRDILKTQ